MFCDFPLFFFILGTRVCYDQPADSVWLLQVKRQIASNGFAFVFCLKTGEQHCGSIPLDNHFADLCGLPVGPFFFLPYFFWDMKTNHWFSRVPCYKICLLQFPLQMYLGYVSGTYPFSFPVFLQFPLQLEVPPGQPAALCCSDLGWELSVFCASLLKLFLTHNLESTETIRLFLNENFISLF